jgi:hypothetical protein
MPPNAALPTFCGIFGQGRTPKGRKTTEEDFQWASFSALTCTNHCKRERDQTAD